MAGDDEARARAVLAEMQLRISQGPYCALGVAETTMAPEVVRSAFLTLTKQFHPARFGRMSPELQKLSNEVFLGIKLAHESILRSLGASPRPRSNAHFTSGGVPQVVDVTARTSTGPVPRARSAGTAPPQTQLARGTDRSTPSPASSSQAIRGLTPALGVPRQGTGPVAASRQSRPTGMPATTPMPAMSRTSTGPIQHSQTGPVPRSGTGPVHAAQPGSTLRPTGSIPALQRPGTAPPAAASPSAQSGSMLRQTGSTAAASQAATPATPTGTMPASRHPTPGGTTPASRHPTPGGTTPLSRQPTPGGTSPLSRHPTPGGTSPLSRPPTPQPGVDNFNPPTQRGFDSINPATQRGVQGASSPAQRGVQPSAPSSSATNFNVATVRGVAPAQPTQPLTRVAPAAVFDEHTALHEALQLMEAKNWTAARHALHALAAKIPQSKQYRALLCYTRGREAHGAGRAEDALLEYQRALQLDPDLVQVKQAVAELQRRR